MHRFFSLTPGSCVYRCWEEGRQRRRDGTRTRVLLPEHMAESAGMFGVAHLVFFE